MFTLSVTFHDSITNNERMAFYCMQDANFYLSMAENACMFAEDEIVPDMEPGEYAYIDTLKGDSLAYIDRQGKVFVYDPLTQEYKDYLEKVFVYDPLTQECKDYLD